MTSSLWDVIISRGKRGNIVRYKYSQNLTEASEMTFAENEYQGIEQNGTMKRIPTTKVKQGVHNATHDHVDFATNPVADTNTVGRLLWDDDSKTLSIVRDNTGGTKVSVEIGDEIQVRVKNTTGATILNGQPVYTASALGNTPLIALADGDDPAKNRVTGLMTADIANNGVSYLTTVGLVRNVPIANIIDPADVSWTVGIYLYLSTVTGKLTKNRPSVDTAVRVGIITDISGSNCTILVYLRDDYAKIFADIDTALGNITTSIDALKGVGYTEGTLKTHEDALATLNANDTTDGSVAKAVKDEAENATFTPAVGSGIVASTIKNAINEIGEDTVNLNTRTTYLESVRGHLYGVRMQKSSGICIPTYDAIGMTFRPQVDTIGTPSDFSYVYPWRDIKTVKVDADKNILCTIDDADFEATVGDIMVKIPVFWHRYWTDANYEYYEISDTPRDGFFAGGFYNPDMTIKPYALVGAVKTSNDGRVPHSWVDTPFTHSLPLYSTTAGFQLDALNKSTVSKWSNIDHQAYEMVWHLIFVEIGGYVISPNSQVLGFDVKGAIGQGINGMTNSYSASNVCTVATFGANTFIMAKTRSQYFKVGMLVQIGTAYTSQNIAANRYITDISEYDETNDVIMVDGDSFTTTLTSTIATWAQPLPLAQLMALKNESGYVLQFGANNLSHVCYRGIWDLWGNLYEFMSGLYRYDLQFYACFDWTKMNVNDPRGVAGWIATGIAPNVANGYLKTRQVYKGALGEIGLPAAIGAGSSTWYAAYAYYFNDGYMGLRAVGCGGNWYSGANVGFLWDGYDSPTRTYITVGGRLIG
mgnify:CR=1 FL=1